MRLSCMALLMDEFPSVVWSGARRWERDHQIDERGDVAGVVLKECYAPQCPGDSADHHVGFTFICLGVCMFCIVVYFIRTIK